MKRAMTLLVPVLCWACGDEPAVPDAGPTFDAHVALGTMSVSWTLVDETGAPVTCAEVGAVGVVLKETPRNGAPALIDLFSCSSGAGTTLRHRSEPIYDVEIELTSAGGDPLATVEVEGITLVDGGDVALPAANFVVARTGGFKLRLDMDAPGANCAPVAELGAGVTQVRLALADAAGSCLTVTWVIGEGGPAMSGVYGCPAEARECIENVQDLSVTGLIAGRYTLDVVGFQDVLACYQPAAPFQFEVPGGNLVTDIGTLAVPYLAVEGCATP